MNQQADTLTTNPLLNKEINDLFKGSVHTSMIFAIYDLEGKIILASQPFCNYFALDYHETCGKTIKEIVNGRLSNLPLKLSDEVYSDYQLMITALERIRVKVISTQELVCHINIAPLNQGTISNQTFHMPIWSLEGEVIATYSISYPNNLFYDNLLIKKALHTVKPITINSSLPHNSSVPTLGNFEQKIVFLLTLGFSQNEAAKILGISRGVISSTLSEQISPKFGLYGSNSKRLIEIILQTGYFQQIPLHLLPPIVYEFI